MRYKLLCITLAALPILSAMAALEPPRGPVRDPHLGTLDFVRPNSQNRVHRGGNVWMNITNWGYFGNDGPRQDTRSSDPCPPGRWAPQCEFPAGSGQQYLFQASLWIGAIVETDSGLFTRVSVGMDGWLNPSVNEFWPGEGEENGIVERSNLPGKINCFGENVYDPECVANEEFIALYSDTLDDQPWVISDYDGTPHLPLGIEVRQATRVWSATLFGDFIIVECTIRNIGSHSLRNVYLGFYADCDVGLVPALHEYHTDDITGFLARDPSTGSPLNISYAADNDGRDPGVISGPLLYPHVFGTYVLVPPGAPVKFSYNWWISNGDPSLDYGPAWVSHVVEDSVSTPMGDLRKYRTLSNGEIDFDQIMTDRPTQRPPQVYVDPFTGQTHTEPWSDQYPSPNASDIANGYDTRFLISWGPLGHFDFTDSLGQRNTRLDPGEEFPLTFAMLLGSYFHDPEHPQPSNQTIDSSLFDYAGLVAVARCARILFDNDYSYQPPSPPYLYLHPPRSGGVSFGWLWPMVGTVSGYNMYGIPDSGTGERQQFNTTLLTDTSFEITGLDNGSQWLIQVVTVDDSGFVSAPADTLVRIGAPMPVTGLTASAHGAIVTLNWHANNDPNLTGYRLLRRSHQGDSVSIPVGITLNYTDQSVLTGQRYTYWIIAENSLGYSSYLSESTEVVTWAPAHRILVLDETHDPSLGEYQFGMTNADSIRNRYYRLLADLGVEYDVMRLPDTSLAHLEFEDLANYDLVIWHSENGRRTLTEYELIQQRESVLTLYVRSGGRLLRIARSFLFGSLDLNPGINYGQYSYIDELLAPQHFDSFYVASTNTMEMSSAMQLIGGQSAQTGFMSFILDTARLRDLNFRGVHYNYLPDVDVFWPREPTRPLYRSIVLPTDSSGLCNQPVAVIGQSTIIMGVPLYFMFEDDAREILRACIDTLRSASMGTKPLPPRAVVPLQIALYPNYPNPFNPSTTIRFDLPAPLRVEIAVFNTLGQRVTTLLDELRAAGTYAVQWNGRNAADSPVAAGVYICRLKAGDQFISQKMVLLK
ncbi:MAG: T9SS type A sorting domain-containing protein [Calditrichota bacterium]